MKIPASILALTLLLGVGLACNLAEKLGDDKSVMVTELWPDVVVFPGATKSDTKLPLPVRLLFRTFIQGRASFIIFGTDKSPDEVKNFYKSTDLSAMGWARVEASCFRDTEQVKSNGAMCMFMKGDQDKPKELLGVMVQNESPNTSIIYFRVDTSQMEQK